MNNKRARSDPRYFGILDHDLTDSLNAVDYHFNYFINNGGIYDYRVQLLNGIAQGYGKYQRIGSKVDLVQLSWDCYMYPNGLINPQADLFKLAFVYDRQPNGTLPGYDEIFEQTMSDGSKNHSPMSPYNVDNSARFEIIRDMKFTLSPVLDQLEGLGPFPTTVNTYGSNGRGNMISDSANLFKNTVYSGTGDGISDISTGALYVVAMGLWGDLEFPEAAYNYEIDVRLWFKELN